METWASGEAYERYIGRWSRPVAERFIDWLDPLPGARWLDVGCGTGALTATILECARPLSVRGEDPSEAHVAHARERFADERAGFAVGEAEAIAAPDETYDYVVSGLVLNFVPDTDAALTEMTRVLKPEGAVAAYVWDYSDGMEMLRHFWDAASQLDPSAEELDEGVRFPICAPDALRVTWTDAGLNDVWVEPIEVETLFEDFNDYWSPFTGGQGPAPGYVASLSDEGRTQLRELLRERLVTRSGSKIRLKARAWSVRGAVR